MMDGLSCGWATGAWGGFFGILWTLLLIGLVLLVYSWIYKLLKTEKEQKKKR